MTFPTAFSTYNRDGLKESMTGEELGQAIVFFLTPYFTLPFYFYFIYVEQEKEAE